MAHGGSLSPIGGTIVSEEECATGLGFSSVTEFRRWKTDVGHENQELRSALRKAQDEARTFQWHGKRMLFVLGKVAEHFDGKEIDAEKLRLAVDVMLNKRVDWERELKEWFDGIA